jgi:hypothetical protein
MTPSKDSNPTGMYSHESEVDESQLRIQENGKNYQ